jgi:hypothetical protein
MAEDAFSHLYSKVYNAPLQLSPTPHFFIESIFPDSFYQELIESLPELSCYQSVVSTGDVKGHVYSNRFILPFGPDEFSKLSLTTLFFWEKIQLFLTDERWMSLLISKFYVHLEERFKEELATLRFSPVIQLLRDFKSYSIGPHTDHPVRAITLLFYFPKDASQAHMGTSLYKAKDPNFTCDGLTHHSFDAFEKVKTIPYLPNSLVGFIRTDNSFHGVERLQEETYERNLLNYYLRVVK